MSEVVFVGTSDAFGAGGRRQSAVFARGERGGMLIDCGATTNTGLSALEIPRDEVDVILVSHFHGDHFGGIPGFLYAALYADRRRHALEIAGPPEIEARVHALANAMGHHLGNREWSFPIRYREIRPGETREVGPATIQAFATAHQLEAHPQGYRIQLGAESIAYSGDTGWFEALPRAVAGSGLFICECPRMRGARFPSLARGAARASRRSRLRSPDPDPPRRDDDRSARSDRARDRRRRIRRQALSRPSSHSTP
ncbi:MAG: MBL fold metallo-hydrolase [Deltaproteobacteria bacterium]|nr:MBL fold metallo-hydrolase [Deltaproteobacteria bacterium]